MQAGDTQATVGELEIRRARVLSLRLRKMTGAAIAAICNVSEATVSGDLKWIAQNWRDRYGSAPQIDPAEVVGETMALYQDVETLALLEHSRIGDEAHTRRISPMFAARQRMACLRTAMLAREMQIHLMQDLGILERALGSVQVNLPRAADIRAAYQKARTAVHTPVISAAERKVLETTTKTETPTPPVH